MKQSLKSSLLRGLRFLFGCDLWFTPTGAVALTMFLLQLWFVADWCMGTTFRPMSDWMLWASNLGMALLLALPYALSRRMWLAVLFMLVSILASEANLMYYRTYLQAIPPESYLLAGNLGDFTASVRDSLRWQDLGFIVMAAGGIMLAYGLRRLTKTCPPWFKLRYVSVVCLVLAICFTGMAVRGGFYKAYDKLIQSCYYNAAGVPTYTVAGHITHSLMEASLADKSWPERRIATWLQAHDAHVGEGLDSAATRRNLVLVVCESLESWPLETKIEGKEITPYLNSLLRDSTTFYAPNILTQVGAGRSIDCQLLVCTGLMPMRGSVYSMKYPNADYPSLIKAFNARYPDALTSIYTCDKPITWNQQAVARSFGYRGFVDRSAWRQDEMIGNPAKLSDGSFLRQSVRRLPADWKVGRPAMLTFITYSGHNPFKLPDELRDPAFRVNGLPERLADYITMAHYTDSQLHTLVDYLRSRPDWQETMVVIVGDHEALGADRADFHRALPVVSPGRFTPFIVLNAPRPGRFEPVAGQVDIYPTLLTMLGMTGYTWHGVGVNMLSPEHPHAALGSAGEGIVGATLTEWQTRRLREASEVSDALIRRNFLTLR